MDRPNSYSLAALTITTALSSQAQTAITDLAGMSSLTIEAELSGGTGGTSVNVLVQTRLGSGGTWRDVASLDFTGAAAKYTNVIASAAVAVTAIGSLSANTVINGFLGDQLRAVVTSVGVYTSTSLAVRASVR